MFCPECKSEFRPGFTHCEECGVDLVEVLPAPAPEDHGDHDLPVTVFVSSQAAEAALVASLLEGSGIEVFKFDEHLSNIDSPVALLIGGIKIAVPRNQRDAALDVLKEYRGGAGQDVSQGHLGFFSQGVFSGRTGEDEGE